MFWHWTLQQLNLMACSASADTLKTTNSKLGTDSFVVKHNNSKAGKQAEWLSRKMSAQIPTTQQHVAAGLVSEVASLQDEIEMRGNRQLFLGSGVKFGLASKSHVEQLNAVVDNHGEELITQPAKERFNPHSLWKGAATCATSGTTMSPTVLSIACRGEWSTVGLVLDCHCHFDKTGDQRLGRVLAGMDPNSSNFDILPPHFKIEIPCTTTLPEKQCIHRMGTLLMSIQNFLQFCCIVFVTLFTTTKRSLTWCTLCPVATSTS